MNIEYGVIAMWRNVVERERRSWDLEMAAK